MAQRNNRPDRTEWNRIRESVLRRDGYQCQKCWCQGGEFGPAELHVHHKKPVSEGGTHDAKNLITLCRDCHNRQHDEYHVPSHSGGGEYLLPEKFLPVLEVLKTTNYQRANPHLVREKTGMGKGDVNSALVRLCEEGYAKKITRGLYEFVDEPAEN